MRNEIVQEVEKQETLAEELTLTGVQMIDVLEEEEAEEPVEAEVKQILPQPVLSEAEKKARAKELEVVHTKASQSRESLFAEGYDSGYSAAADDYSTGKVRLEVFGESGRDITEILDHYAMGFEVGYLRKMAEICIN